MGSPPTNGDRSRTARTPGPRERDTPRGSVLTKAGAQRRCRSRSLGQRLPPKPQAPHTAPPAAPRVPGPRPYLNACAGEGGGFIPLQPGLPGLWTRPPPRPAPPPCAPGPRGRPLFPSGPREAEGAGSQMCDHAPCGAGRIRSSQLTGSPPSRSERRWAWLRAPRVLLG